MRVCERHTYVTHLVSSSPHSTKARCVKEILGLNVSCKNMNSSQANIILSWLLFQDMTSVQSFSCYQQRESLCVSVVVLLA